MTTRTSVTVAPSSASLSELSRNFAESGAPKMCAWRALSSRSLWITPTVVPVAMLCSTSVQSDMKNGDCTRIGRQLESGLVPVSLYSFIISSDWRCLSFL